MICKIINGIVMTPPRNEGNRINVDCDPVWLAEHGYTDIPEDQLPVSIATPEPTKYSTLKIIRALGDQWQDIRDQLAGAGVLDEFFAANYLREDDPVFAAFVAQLPDALKSALDNCIWEAQ